MASDIPADGSAVSTIESTEASKRIALATTERLARRMNSSQYLNNTTSDERSALAAQVSTAITAFIDVGRPVYLEGLGIIAPAAETELTPRLIENKVLLRDETTRMLNFEKCSDLVAYHREVYSNLVESHELTQKVLPGLPLGLQVKWGETSLRSLIRGFLQFLAKQIVVTGYSDLLEPLGTFYAGHNRQGNSFVDWFAGADIFFVSRHAPILKVGPARLVDRVVLDSAWELFEATYGAPHFVSELNIKDELARLDADSASLGLGSSPAPNGIRIACFIAEGSKERTAVLCSDGFRRLFSEQRAPGHTGCELVCSIALETASAATKAPRWALSLFTLAWVLMTKSKNNTLKPGAGLSLGTALAPYPDCRLTTVLVNRYNRVRTEQLSSDGSFHYLSLNAITEDEARVAKLYSTEHLLALLKHRGLDQIIRPVRSSVVARSGLLVSETPEPAPEAEAAIRA